jgi:CheY-like chemotaxis protein
MTHRLLLADDSVTIQRVIQLTFADEDIDVVTVGDGQLAIDYLDADPPPDIVLADVDMPKRDGYEVAAYVKSSPRLAHIPVVLLTGAFEPIDQARALQAGSSDVLAKPFEPQMVINRVKQLLGRKREAEAPAAPQGLAPPMRPPASPRPPARSSMPMNDDHATEQDQPAPSEPGQPAEAPVSLDDYFDKLDAAFSSLQGGAPAAGADKMRAEEWIESEPAPVQAPSAPPAPAAAAPVPAAAAPVRAAPNPPAAAAVPSMRSMAPAPYQAAPSAPQMAPQAAPPLTAPPQRREQLITPMPSPPAVKPAWAPQNPMAAAPPPVATRPPAPPPPTLAVPPPVVAKPVPVAPPLPVAPPPPATPLTAPRSASDPFAELSTANLEAAARPAAPVITDEVIEQVVSRVLLRLSDQVIRETVTQIVAKTAEQLVQDEIRRIKAEGQ